MFVLPFFFFFVMAQAGFPVLCKYSNDNYKLCNKFLFPFFTFMCFLSNLILNILEIKISACVFPTSRHITGTYMYLRILLDIEILEEYEK